MDRKKRIVIIGATSAIAEHCARLWLIDHPASITLVGRNRGKLEAVAADLMVRSPQSTLSIRVEDFLAPAGIKSLVEDLAKEGAIDTVLIAHGSLPDQLDCQRHLDACRAALEINALSPALYAEAFAHQFERQGSGTLALISSVAGDRGRKTNYIYGAAKSLLSSYAQGLQHRFAGTPVTVVLIKPGPTDTPMTAHLKDQGARLAPVEKVAKQLIRAIDQRRTTAYVPIHWAFIMWTIRHLPNAIFNRLNI